MQQLASSMRFDEPPANKQRGTPAALRSEEDWIALQQRCDRIEQMVAELLLKNAALRMQAASVQIDDK